MQVNPMMKWKLRLIDPVENLNWQAQYTGFDPPLELPSALTNDVAQEFLLAFARFEDRVTALNNQQPRNRPTNQLYGYLRNMEESKFSNSLPDTIKRAWFHTGLMNDSRGRLLNHLKDYLCHDSDRIKATIPPTPPGYSGGKAQRKLYEKKIEASKALYQKQEGESWEGYVQRFIGYCKEDPAISPRGFLDAMAQGIKAQYTEPWLLYTGQSIDELRDTLEMLNAPEQHRHYIAQLRQAFEESGFAASVDTMRGLAMLPEAQAQKRTVIPLGKYTGRERQNRNITKVGGIWQDDEAVCRIER